MYVAHWDEMVEIAKSSVSIPIIANGDVWEREDIMKLKQKTNVTSVMISRGALRNVSIFSPNQLSMKETIQQYIKKVNITIYIQKSATSKKNFK